MGVLTTAIFSAVSIVWDREFGFLREMLVAPVARASLVVGKALGGASVATVQGTIMLVLAPAVGIPLTLRMVAGVVAASALMAFTLTAFGIMVASHLERMESFQIVMQFLLLPMLFLSGALFPLSGLPGWLAVLTRINPVTYAVDPLRRAVFAARDLPAEALARFGAGVTVFGRLLPIWVEVLIVGCLAAVFLGFAILGFQRTE